MNCIECKEFEGRQIEMDLMESEESSIWVCPFCGYFEENNVHNSTETQ